MGAHHTKLGRCTMAALPSSKSSSKDSKNHFLRSYADAAACSLMVGLGETYLPAFGLTFGLSQIGAGLLSSLPLLTGGILQLAAPRIAHTVGSHKKWVIACAGTQVFVFGFLAFAAAWGAIAPSLLFALAAVYWGAGLAAAPTWNNWIETIVPASQLTHFLAVRSRIIQIAAFLAFLGGGLWLQRANQSGDLGIGYLLLFLAAALSRILSMLLLARHSETREPRNPSKVRIKVREAMRTFGRAPESRFLIYLLGTQVMVQISGPYFTPYMLGHLKFSYSTYAILISANYAARIAAYPLLSHIVRRFGAHKSLRLGGLMIAASPLAWSLTTNIIFLGIAQIFAGFAWALYELSNTLMIFEKVPASKRTSVLSCYNFLNACAIVAGSLIGGFILKNFPSESAYGLLFTLSGTGRLITLAVLTGIGLSQKRRVLTTSDVIDLHQAPPASLTPEPLQRAQGS
jgi:MFS family permease